MSGAFGLVWGRGGGVIFGGGNIFVLLGFFFGALPSPLHSPLAQDTQDPRPSTLNSKP